MILPEQKLFSVPTFGVQSNLYRLAGSAELDASGEKPTWKTSLDGGFDLTRAGRAYAEVIARYDIDAIEGALAATATAFAGTNGIIVTRGTITSTGLAVAMPRAGRVLRVEQSEISADWDIEADPAALSVALRKVTFRSPLASFDLTGTASPQALDVRGEAKTSLGPIMDLAQQFAPKPIDLAGAIEAKFLAKGNIGQNAHGALTVYSFGPVRYEQMGTEVFSEAIHFETDAAAEWRGGELAALTVNVPDAWIGDLLTASLSSRTELLDGTGAKATAQILVKAPFLLAFVPPAKWEELEMAVDAAGSTTGTLSMDGPLLLNASGLQLGDAWTVGGNLATDLSDVEWMKSDMGEYLGGVRDEREFTVKLDPKSPLGFIYSDSAVTRTQTVQGPMDIQIEDIRIENSTTFEVNKPILVALPAGTIGSFRFPAEAMEMVLPTTTFSGNLKVDMEKSDFIVAESKGEMQGIGSGSGSGNFNWSDFSWSALAKAEVADISDLIGAFRLDPDMMKLIPELHGKAAFSMDLRGSDPRPPFDFSKGLPLRGSAMIDWSDVSAQSGDAWWVNGIAGNARFDSTDDGNAISLAGLLGIEEVGLKAIANKPLRGLAVQGTLTLDDFDVLQISIPEAVVGNYKMAAGADFSASGLSPFLLEGSGDGMESWLRGPRFDGTAHFSAGLSGFNETHPLVSSSGTIDWHGRVGSTPGKLLEFQSVASADSVSVAFADLFALDNLSGRWDAIKTYRLDRSVRLSSKPTEGTFSIDRIAFSKPPAQGEILQTVITVQGFERGLRISTGSRDFLGGPATTSISLTVENGEPALRAEMEITGLRGGKLSPYLRDLGGRQDEISGVATMAWVFPQSGGGNVLDNLTIRLRSTQIGKKALSRLLQALDANQDDPRFQNAITALAFGAPVGGHFFLENSLISMGAQLRLPAGFMVPLPILDRAPLGEIFAVYGLQQKAGMIGQLHDPLLLLLQSDLDNKDSNSTETGTFP